MIFKESLFLNNFNLSIFFKKKRVYVYIYNNNYYSVIKITKNTQIKLNKNNCLELLYNNICTKPTLEKIKNFLKQLYLCNFAKIKFTGKGYKIKKNSCKSLVLLFNRAHTTTVWWKNIFLKKLKKYKIYIQYTNKNKSILDTILKIRPINVFTKKGLRKSRQILLKKKGKK
jgi:hypothetical protein